MNKHNIRSLNHLPEPSILKRIGSPMLKKPSVPPSR